MNTDRIEKTVLLRAPRARVWNAIADATQFGTWFGVRFDGPFVAGQRLRGRIEPTEVDPEVAKLQAPHAGKTFEWTIERIEPMSLFSARWHPFAVDPARDYSSEPTTLIEFTLRDAPGGTELRIVESGFDQIPLGRRAAAFTANEGGWTHQLELIAKYLSGDYVR